MLAKILWTMCSVGSLCSIAACRPADAARPESHSTLTVNATFIGVAPASEQGTIRMTVRGIGDTAECGGRRTFSATYDGTLAHQRDATYVAQLYSASPTIATDDGCSVPDLHVEQVSSTQLDARLGDLVGTGTLTFQTLTAVDGDELTDGKFDDLHGDVTFR
jgi:hypothetical protein